MRTLTILCLALSFSMEALAQKGQPCMRKGNGAESAHVIGSLTDVVQKVVQQNKNANECRRPGFPINGLDELQHSVDEIVVKLMMKEQCLKTE